MRAMYFIGVFLLGGLSGCGASSSVAEEKTAIINLVQSAYGGSSGDMLIEPVIVRTKYGVADWVQGEGGGRALVRKEGGGWKVVATAGDEMRDVEFLTKAGVPEAEAKALVNSLIASERQLSDAKLAKFDSYVANAVR
jgi:hypothetical protein